MTQTTEQKVRTHLQQVTDIHYKIAKYVCSATGMVPVEFREYMDRELCEAEARGAAEQRRKDAEGYLFYNPDTGTEFLPSHPVESGECTDAENIREATSTELLSELQDAWESWKEDRAEKDKIAANVAALEARVKELETENARLKTAQFFGHDEAESGSDDISTFFDDHEPGTILEIDGYRHVNTKWVFWDGNSPHVFDTEDEASAALKREGGE